MGLLGWVCHTICCAGRSLPGRRHGFKFPAKCEDIDKPNFNAAWFTKALRAEGTIPADVEVVKVRRREAPLAGLLSVMCIVEVEYGGPGANSNADLLPAEMYVKFSPTVLKTRTLVDMFQLTRAEFLAYTELAPELPMRLPRVLYADMNWTSESLCIILEKVDAEFKDQLMPDAVTPEVATRCVTLLGELGAKFHFSKHDLVALGKRGINAMDHPAYKLLGPASKKGWHAIQTYGKQDPRWTFDLRALGPGAEEVFLDLSKNVHAFCRAGRAEKLSVGLCHGDCRIDNFFFYKDAATGEDKVGMLDLQKAVIEPVIFDLAWFVCTSIPVDLADQLEPKLLDLYFETLNKHGVAVTAQDRPMWEEQYQLQIMSTFLQLVVGCEGIDQSMPRVVELSDLQLKRSIAAWKRHDLTKVWQRAQRGELQIQKAGLMVRSMDGKSGVGVKGVGGTGGGAKASQEMVGLANDRA